MTSAQRLALSVVTAGAVVASAASAQLVTEGGQKFSVVLSGANECNSAGTCGIGDLNASGTADVTINPGQRRVCWEITTTGVHPDYTIVGAHIHTGVAGQNGGIVIHLSAIKNGTATGCTTTASPTGALLTRALLDQIRTSPENYYINIHWADTTPPTTLPSFAPGAIRGQLSKGRLK